MAENPFGKGGLPSLEPANYGLILKITRDKAACVQSMARRLERYTAEDYSALRSGHRFMLETSEILLARYYEASRGRRVYQEQVNSASFSLRETHLRPVLVSCMLVLSPRAKRDRLGAVRPHIARRAHCTTRSTKS